MRQARDIENRANRPMMVAEIVPPEGTKDEVGLRVTNAGKSVARNVLVEFDPPLPEPDLNRLNQQGDATYYATNIEQLNNIFEGRKFLTWTPGMEVTAPYWAPPKTLGLDSGLSESAEGVPAVQKVVVKFQDERGIHYQDTFALDVHTVLGLRFSETEQAKIRKELNRLANSVERISRSNN